MSDSPLQRASEQRAKALEQQRAAEEAHMAQILAFADQANAAAAEFVARAPATLFKPVPTTPVRMRRKGVFKSEWVVVGRGPSSVSLVAIALGDADPDDRWSGTPLWALDREGGWWYVTTYRPEVAGTSTSGPPRCWIANERRAEDMSGLGLAIATTGGGSNQRNLWDEGRWDEIASLVGLRLLEILEGRVIYELRTFY